MHDRKSLEQQPHAIGLGQALRGGDHGRRLFGGEIAGELTAPRKKSEAREENPLRERPENRRPLRSRGIGEWAEGDMGGKIRLARACERWRRTTVTQRLQAVAGGGLRRPVINEQGRSPLGRDPR